MLEATLKKQLQAYLEKVVQPIEIVASLDASPKAREMEELLREITSLSTKISYRVSDDASVRAPSFAINRIGTDVGVRFAGIPLGHEFTSLVLALLQVGGHPIKFDDAVIEQIKNLDGDYVFEAFISLSCHNCPEVVQALNSMSIINPRIKVTTIDGGLFKDEVESRQILAVPMMFLNGEHFGQGRMSAEEILAKLDTGAGKRKAAELQQERSLRRADRRRRSCRRGRGNLCRPQRHPHRRRRRPLRRPGARYAVDRELRLGEGNRRPALCRLAGRARQAVRGRHHEFAARRQTGEERQAVRSDDRRRRRIEKQVGDHLDRRPLARNQRAGRKRVQEPRRGLLPALRRPAVQGQARVGDRRR